MAVTVANNPAGLRLKFDLGKDELTGNTKVKSKTFSNVKHNASSRPRSDFIYDLRDLRILFLFVQS